MEGGKIDDGDMDDDQQGGGSTSATAARGFSLPFDGIGLIMLFNNIDAAVPVRQPVMFRVGK